MTASQRRLPLREHAVSIWKAGLAAVDASRLVRSVITVCGTTISVCGRSHQLKPHSRLIVVGGGKAGMGMARGVIEAVGPELTSRHMCGWLNVPADCVVPLSSLTLHAARPAGVNEPTEEGVAGSLEILKLVASTTPDDLCLVLISGGGSALLPAPSQGVTLASKRRVTQLLMQRGATIQELNTVRKRLSRLKGGGLARALPVGQMETLIISDVVGDPLDFIASGPTVPDETTNSQALDVLQRFVSSRDDIPEDVYTALTQPESKTDRLPIDLQAASQSGGCWHPRVNTTVTNHVIGNNRAALNACAQFADSLGYRVIDNGSDHTGEASELGMALARICREIQRGLRRGDRPVCILDGGEPIVRLPKATECGKGGRNQQLVLAAQVELFENDPFVHDRMSTREMHVPQPAPSPQIVVLSGGTDGEDGPTDAAGGIACWDNERRALAMGLKARDYLARCDAYHFLSQSGGLLVTGPTHTNVMDVRVALIEPND